MIHNNAACLLGAFVADAASLGTHWIYDVDRIAKIAAQNGGQAAFAPLMPANFEGVPAYFAHGMRQNGMATQYGEVLRLAMGYANQGDFDVAAYQQGYGAYFGAGGGYLGYIDKPTRGTLANIAAERLDPSGIDDDQLPALAPLPAVLLAGGDISAALRVTHVNNEASAYATVFVDLLGRVLAGAAIGDALRDSATGPVAKTLVEALESDISNSTAYGEITGRACHLNMAMPLAFHIMARADSYQNAIEHNLLAGGDSAGRAIVIGAVMGAAGGVGDIPLEWILAMHDAANIWDECQGF